MLSYRKAVSTVKRRLRRLKESGIANNAMKVLEANLETFYHKTGLKKRGRGISIDDRMSAKQKRDMNDILRAFLKDETSTLTGMKVKAAELGIEASDIKELSEKIDDSMLVLLADQTLTDSMGSQVINEIYNDQRIRGYDPDIARIAMSNLYLNTDISNMTTVSDRVDAIMKNIDGLLKQGFDQDWEGDIYE